MFVVLYFLENFVNITTRKSILNIKIVKKRETETILSEKKKEKRTIDYDQFNIEMHRTKDSYNK